MLGLSRWAADGPGLETSESRNAQNVLDKNVRYNCRKPTSARDIHGGKTGNEKDDVHPDFGASAEDKGGFLKPSGQALSRSESSLSSCWDSAPASRRKEANLGSSESFFLDAPSAREIF